MNRLVEDVMVLSQVETDDHVEGVLTMSWFAQVTTVLDRQQAYDATLCRVCASPVDWGVIQPDGEVYHHECDAYVSANTQTEWVEQDVELINNVGDWRCIPCGRLHDWDMPVCLPCELGIDWDGIGQQ